MSKTRVNLPQKKQLWRRLILLLILGIILIICCLYLSIQITLPDVSYLKNKNPKTTALIEQRKIEAKKAGRKFYLRQQWVSFQQIPELLKRTIRISEDANFYFHDGIDLEELEESVKKNIEKGQFARGGSTITQQLAKNLYLSIQKSIWRKIKEYFIAKRLESEISKNRIFHIYLNIIELGQGIFGVSAASHYYFHKSVSHLDIEEIIRLTAIIPRPLKVDPTRDSKWLLWRCRWITGKLLLYKYIEKAEHDRLILKFNPE